MTTELWTKSDLAVMLFPDIPMVSKTSLLYKMLHEALERMLNALVSDTGSPAVELLDQDF